MIVKSRWTGFALMQIGLAGCGVTMLQSPRATPARPSIQPMTASRNSNGSVRTVCRGSRLGANWAITDYVASRQCESGGSLTYNAMVIEDLSYYPIGSTVLICSDQRRP